MGLSSLQASMDSSDWLQVPSSSSGATEPMVASSRSSMEKRLRPHQDQALIHCPRCDSTHTKFCYYNNYSLSQPRYFCKSCRRYWTKGGTLRNIPVGGVCRKNKKLSSSSKKSTTHENNNITHLRQPPPQQNVNADANGISSNSVDLQLSYPESPVQFSAHPHFMFENLCSSAPTAIDFMENGGGGGEYETADHFPATVATGGYGAHTGNTHGLAPEFIRYDHEYYETMMNEVDVKPRVFAWQDQTGCYSDLHGSGAGRNGSPGYLLGLGSSWAGLMNGYGSSATDPFV